MTEEGYEDVDNHLIKLAVAGNAQIIATNSIALPIYEGSTPVETL